MNQHQNNETNTFYHLLSTRIIVLYVNKFVLHPDILLTSYCSSKFSSCSVMAVFIPSGSTEPQTCCSYKYWVAAFDPLTKAWQYGRQIMIPSPKISMCNFSELTYVILNIKGELHLSVSWL